MSTTKKEAVKTAAAATAATPVAYVGPTYIGGLPVELQKKIDQVPAIKGLLVPISKLAETGVAIATKGTALNTLYEAVQDKLAQLED